MGRVESEGPRTAARAPTKRARRGSLLMLLFIVATVLFILGMSLSEAMSQRRHQTAKMGEDLGAYHVAKGGIEWVLWRLRNLFEEPLVTYDGDGPRAKATINEPLLDLLDFDRAKDWARTFQMPSHLLVEDATCTIHAEFVQVQRNEFTAFIDRVEPRVPEALQRYQEQKDRRNEDEDIEGKVPLAGWSGLLRLTSEGVYQGTRRVIEVSREIKVTDLTPPAPDHTLFIDGKGNEKIEKGTFLLSNLDLPDVIQTLLLQLTLRANEMLRLPLSEDQKDVLENVNKIQEFLTNGDGNEPAEGLGMIHELASHVKDEQIKDKVDSIILSLNPRNWGRVRTNGSLYVKLPFFAADDIINYFADDTIFGHQRPEVGFLYHNNRLHDPYLGVYTHFEGLIYKEYRRLNPLGMGPSTEPTKVAPQRYTINTQFNYVDRYPDRRHPGNLARIVKKARDQAHLRFKQPKVKLVGTPNNPLRLDGIWFCDGQVEIGGPYTGRGMVIAKTKATLLRSLEPVNEGDGISLLALGGPITLARDRAEFFIKGGVYAKDGIKGQKNQSLEIQGNLVVNKLNRQNMPKEFRCRFDPDLKNHMIDNVVGVISKNYASYKERGADAKYQPVRISAKVRPFVEVGAAP